MVPPESFTVSEAICVPAVVGMPLIVPVPLMERPLGRLWRTKCRAKLLLQLRVPSTRPYRSGGQSRRRDDQWRRRGDAGRGRGGRCTLERHDLHGVIESRARRNRNSIGACRRDGSIQQAHRRSRCILRLRPARSGIGARRIVPLIGRPGEKIFVGRSGSERRPKTMDSWSSAIRYSRTCPKERKDRARQLRKPRPRNKSAAAEVQCNARGSAGGALRVIEIGVESHPGRHCEKSKWGGRG